MILLPAQGMDRRRARWFVAVSLASEDLAGLDVYHGASGVRCGMATRYTERTVLKTGEISRDFGVCMELGEEAVQVEERCFETGGKECVVA